MNKRMWAGLDIKARKLKAVFPLMIGEQLSKKKGAEMPQGYGYTSSCGAIEGNRTGGLFGVSVGAIDKANRMVD